MCVVPYFESYCLMYKTNTYQAHLNEFMKQKIYILWNFPKAVSKHLNLGHFGTTLFL